MKAPVTLTIDSLADLLSAKTGAEKDVCIQFIREYFNVITEGVAAGGTVSARNLGTFHATSRDVTFGPDDVFTGIVNAPFAAFPPIPLLDDEDIEHEVVAEEEYPEQEQEPVTVADTEPEPESIPETEPDMVIVPDEPLPEPEPATESEPVVNEPVAEPVIIPQPQPAPEPEPEPDYEEQPEPEAEPEPTFAEKRREARKRPTRCRMYVMMGIMFVVGLLTGLTLGYLWYHKINAFFSAPIGSMEKNPVVVMTDTIPVPVETKTVAVADTILLSDSIQEPAAKVEKTDTVAAKTKPRQPRYDVVDKRTYLATLARRYYGCADYWVYIYEANKARKNLRHPDRIAPGTKLLIPYTDELPLTGNDSADVLAAKRRGTAVYAKYK